MQFAGRRQQSLKPLWPMKLLDPATRLTGQGGETFCRISSCRLTVGGRGGVRRSRVLMTAFPPCQGWIGQFCPFAAIPRIPARKNSVRRCCLTVRGLMLSWPAIFLLLGPWTSRFNGPADSTPAGRGGNFDLFQIHDCFPPAFGNHTRLLTGTTFANSSWDVVPKLSLSGASTWGQNQHFRWLSESAW